MKFLFVTATPLNALQGSGTYVGIATLKETLERLGHSVKILAPDFWCPNFVLRRYLFNCFLPAKIRRTSCAPPPFDIVVGFDCDGYRLKTSAPYIVSVKGVLADEARQEKGIVRRLLSLQAKWEMKNAKKADIVVTTSQYCRKTIQEAYRIHPGKIRVVPEMIDLKEWEELLSGASGQQGGKKGVVVLTVCRMYPRKNLGLLLRAWRQVRRKEPSVRLRIVGTGQEYKRWVLLAKELELGDSVLFLGDRSREELAEEYQQCDIFCLPSRQEGFGIVFLEAMAAGKPIVAARSAAVPEVVRHEKEGLLVSPEDPHRLAEALLKLIKNSRLRSQMGESGRNRVREYEAAEVTQKFLQSLPI